MKVKDILKTVDEMYPNKYTDEIKMMFISDLDSNITESVIRPYNRGVAPFIPYKSIEQSVIAPERNKMMYVYYVKAQIDANNNETVRFNNSMALYNSYFSEYQRAYIRSHRSSGGKFKV